MSPTTADDVRADLGADVDVVLDGGPCPVGVESTIVDCTGAAPVILRVGGVSGASASRSSAATVAIRDRGERARARHVAVALRADARVVVASR